MTSCHAWTTTVYNQCAHCSCVGKGGAGEAGISRHLSVLAGRGGDLGRLGGRSPKIWSGGRPIHPSPPIFWEVVLSDAHESTNRIKKGIIKELLSKIVVFLVKKGSYTTFNTVKIRKIWKKKGKIRKPSHIHHCTTSFEWPTTWTPHHFFTSTTVIANHKTSSSSASSICHPGPSTQN